MNAIVSARRSDISPEEWEMRVNLAACYRLTALFGWDDLIFTHISARVPGPEHHFLINPYGMGFEEMTASSLVKVDLDGRKVSDSPYEINPAGFVIHSAVHAAREDAHCVMHVHSIHGTAVSAQEDGLLPLTQHSLIVLRSLGYHDYEGIALEDEEKPRLVADLGRHTHLMLRNHGLLTVGASPAEAFVAMYFFEAACMMQVRAQAGGGKLRTIGQPILVGITRQMAAVTTNQGPGTLVWPSLLRKLDRHNPGYAQ
ncbi:class II aldolase/adducin family protein [Burkholderia gladioli]|uniref:class II aldolase/adducin family protein n=1 Tax=Burkholderia gladioli TaxID=28095 RepID=UPI0016414B5B|nr:class II aldolase/adducin family protein [Burkholderia gladioli]MDN7802895.1 class II aldolase/adducin family protein [Burkholderia gladioli]